MTIASSPRVALEHWHRGWANITSVALSLDRLIGALAGQTSGGLAGWPGVVANFHKALIPKATAGTQSETATAMIACFFTSATKDIPRVLLLNRPNEREH